MRLAWFRPTPPDADNPLDESARVIASLPHQVDLFDAPAAHAFVWRHARQPYDLPVYELGSDDTAYMWPYVLHYPGLLVLQARQLYEQRIAMLRRQNRLGRLAAEVRFGGHALMRAPLLASRLVVVADERWRGALSARYPDARVRTVPPAVRPPEADGPGPDDGERAPESAREPAGRTDGAEIVVGVLDTSCLDVIEGAWRRARAQGVPARLLVDTPRRVLRDSHVVLAMHWPPHGERQVAAVAAMAWSRPVVVMETEATACWPALDPQTWQPRDPIPRGEPVAVSIDPCDHEHSLVLALRRLAADRSLREQLARAGRTWWRQHAGPADAIGAWHRAIDEAISLEPPPRPGGWPAHLIDDGTDMVRQTLAEFGIDVQLAFSQSYPGSVVSRASSTGAPIAK